MIKKRFIKKIVIIVAAIELFIFSTAIADGFYAFSLREASRCAKDGKFSKEVMQLAGITRIIGMVSDQGNDIILIGKKVPGLPEASLDDLVVALQARLIYDQWPEVSIDPTEDSLTSGVQKVTFRGGLEGTEFGRDFLLNDLILKKYSLEMIRSLKSVPSYKSLCADLIKTSLENSGVEVDRINWLRQQDFQNKATGLYDRNINTEESSQTRFWFTPMEPYQFISREGVFCIKELRLNVKQEIIYSRSPSDEQHGFQSAGDLFSSSFTENFYQMATLYPLLKRLKILYDLVAVAEGIRNFQNTFDLSFLLKEYPLKNTDTPKEVEFFQVFGMLERSDKRPHFIQISGGVKFEMELKWLNYGDVTPLKKIILETRPSPNAVSWQIPLEQWEMPNSSDIKDILTQINKSDFSKIDNVGMVVFVQSLSLSGPGEKTFGHMKKFSGFSPPPPPAPSTLSTPRIEYFSGVSMKMDVNEKSFEKNNSDDLKSLRDRTLKIKPKTDSLLWDTE